MNSVTSNNLCLKYKPSGCKNIFIRKYDFEPKTIFFLQILTSVVYLSFLQVCSVPRQNVYEYRKYLGSRDTDTVLAAQLYLADNHALHLIPVPPAGRNT